MLHIEAIRCVVSLQLTTWKLGRPTLVVFVFVAFNTFDLFFFFTANHLWFTGDARSCKCESSGASFFFFVFANCYLPICYLTFTLALFS